MHIEGQKYQPKGGFFERYAKLVQDKQDANQINEKAEFEAGYRKGSLRFATASKYLKLSHAGLDNYVEACDNGLHIVWERRGDQIVRTDNDTNWIDELLEQEGNH